jgi:hypothetical protein
MTLSDLVCLFHTLAGMCIGWMYGAQSSALASVVGGFGGLFAGMFTGFLLGHLPKAIRVTRAEVPQKHRMFAAAFGVIGLAAGALFWWACFNSVCN